jgi:hypothetical protein
MLSRFPVRFYPPKEYRVVKKGVDILRHAYGCKKGSDTACAFWGVVFLRNEIPYTDSDLFLHDGPNFRILSYKFPLQFSLKLLLPYAPFSSFTFSWTMDS